MQLLLLNIKLSFSSDFQTFPEGVVGWVGVENEINANSAFNQVEVEVEAELGKNCDMVALSPKV